MNTFDVIIVLGFDVTEAGLVPDEGKSRVQLAVNMISSGESSAVIFSGNVSHLHSYVPRVTEADSMKGYALSIGLPETAIYTEPLSRNTYENATYSKEIVDKHNWRTIIVVTSEFHVARARHLFEKVYDNNYTLKFRTCENRLKEQERNLVVEIEQIKTDELLHNQSYTVPTDNAKIQTLLLEYLQQRTAS